MFTHEGLSVRSRRVECSLTEHEREDGVPALEPEGALVEEERRQHLREHARETSVEHTYMLQSAERRHWISLLFFLSSVQRATTTHACCRVPSAESMVCTRCVHSAECAQECAGCTRSGRGAGSMRGTREGAVRTTLRAGPYEPARAHGAVCAWPRGRAPAQAARLRGCEA